MPKFSTNVALMDPEYKPANFGPGDDVPEWALDQVGAHVLEAEEASDSDESDDKADESEDQGEGQGNADESGHDGDSEADDDSDGEDSAPPTDEQPDFTAPAPVRRGRSRRQ